MRSLYVRLSLFFLLITSVSQAQVVSSGGGTGAWNDPNSWSPAAVPTIASGTVTIQSGHTITVTDTRSIDQLTVNGTLIINNGVELTINDGSGTDLIVNGVLINQGVFTLHVDLPPPPVFNATAVINGTFENSGTINGYSAARMSFGAGSVYVHQYTTSAGLIPVATWHSTSTCLVTGYTSNFDPPANLGQNFGNFIWDTPLLENYINLAGALTSVAGDLTFRNIPFAYLSLGEGTSFTVNIGGDLIIENSYLFVNGSGVANLNIAGDVIFTDNPDLSFVFDGSTTFDIAGNLVIDGGTCNTTYEGPGDITFRVAGDYTVVNSPVINNGGTGTYTLTFDGIASSPQTYNSIQALTGFSYVIQNGSRVNVPDGSAFVGAGDFTLQGGATMGVGSVDGLVTGVTAGAVRVSGLRDYVEASNIVYYGSAAQSLGNEWGTGGALDGVAVNLEIANTHPGGVTNNIIGSTSLVGNLTLTSNPFHIGNSNTLVIQADFIGNGGTIGGLSTSNLTFAGDGNIVGNIEFASGARNLNNFTIDRAGVLILGTDLTIHGTLAFESVGSLRVGGQTLTIQGDLTQAASGGITSQNTASRLVIAGSGALTTLPFCTDCGAIVFSDVLLRRTGGATYPWNSSVTIGDSVALTSGTLVHSSGLTMGTGSTFVINSGASLTTNPLLATTRYNLGYVGNHPTTGLELPTTATDRLENLTIAGDVGLDKNIIINGNVNITSGTLNAGTRNITMRGATFGVNGGAFTINNANTVTFARAGTTAISGSTVDGVQFGNVIINSGAAVSAPNNGAIRISNGWTNNGTFVPNNGTVTFNGSGQLINPNGQPFYNVIIDGTATMTGTWDVNNNLVINSTRSLSAGSFTVSVAGLWDNSGTFNAGTGTVILDGTAQDLDPSGQSFFNLTLAGSGTKTLLSDLDVNGTLTIGSGTTMDVSTSTNDVHVAGNWTNNGTFVNRDGTVFLDGATNQTVSGTSPTTFANLTCSNAAAINVTSAQSLSGVLTISAGTFNPNGNFTLLSSASGDARIAPLGGTASIGTNNTTGAMIVQRYLPNSNSSQSYRYISSPVQNATVSLLKDDFPVTGTFTDPSTVGEWPQFPNMAQNSPSMFVYNEAHTPTSSVEDRYESFPPAGSASTANPQALLVNGRGYAAFIRQTGPITVDLTGRPGFGPVAVDVTAQSGGGNDGWNLIGNPYPSPINWSNVTRPGTVSAQIAMKDNTGNSGLTPGAYVYFTAGGSAVPETYDGTIAAGQAFWVRATSNATITFQEDDKAAVATPTMHREGETPDVLRIKVAGNGRADELVIQFAEEADDAIDLNFDAVKLKNDYINFSSLSADGLQMAINGMKPISCSREIPLVLNNVSQGNYAFTFKETMNNGIRIRLLDAFTGNVFEVTDADTQYEFAVTSDPQTFGASRFKVFVGYKDAATNLPMEATAVCEGMEGTVKIQNSEPGLRYFAMIGGNTVSAEEIGNGGELLVTIDQNALKSGDNTVVIMTGVAGCTAVPMDSPLTLTSQDVPQVSAVEATPNCGAGSVVLRASASVPGATYRWSDSPDFSQPIVGATGAEFMTPVLTKTKTFYVEVINALGCAGNIVAVDAVISYPYEIASVHSTSSCESSAATLTASGAPEGGSYRWYTESSATQPLQGVNGHTYTTSVLNEPRTFYVSIVNAEGCEGARVPVLANVAPLQPATITVDGNTLVSNHPTGNQWYLDGVLIPGATAPELEVSASGEYKLEVTSGECKVTAEQTYVITGDIAGLPGGRYKIYPNPTQGDLRIDVESSNTVTVGILDLTGRQVIGGTLRAEGKIQTGRLDITSSPDGMYLLMIRDGEAVVKVKIIKHQ